MAANEIEFKIKLTAEKIKKFFNDNDKWTTHKLSVDDGGIRNDFYYAEVKYKDDIQKHIKAGKVPVKRIRYEGTLKNFGKNASSINYLLSDNFDPKQPCLIPSEVLYTEKKRIVNNGVETNIEYEVSGKEAEDKIAAVKDESKYFCWFNKQKKYLRVITKSDKNIHLEFVNVNGLLYLEAEIVGLDGSVSERLSKLEKCVEDLGFDIKDRDGTPWVVLLGKVK